MEKGTLSSLTAQGSESNALDLTRLRQENLPVRLASAMYFILNVSLNFSKAHLPHT